MLDLFLAVVAVPGLVVAATSGRLRRLPVSEPLLALLAGVVVGPAVLGFLDIGLVDDEAALVHESTRILLAVSVMAIALRYPFAAVRSRARSVLLLLLVVMPAMAAVSSGVTALSLGVGLGTALLVGTAVSPTDPVLASSVVTGAAAKEALPARVRQTLSLESGANDGLALPLVLLAIAVAGPEDLAPSLAESAWQVLGATVAGVTVGWLGAQVLRAGEQHGSTEPIPQAFFTLLLALGTLGLAGLLRVDGVLAVFVAGLTVNVVLTGQDRDAELSVDEGINRFAVLPLFVALGAMAPWGDWADLGWGGAALVVGVLLLRRLPVVLALSRGLQLRLRDAMFLGWFGPIGVSALFYVTLEAERLGLDERVLAAGSLVVVASTVFHGMTSSVGLRLYESAAATYSGRPEGR